MPAARVRAPSALVLAAVTVAALAAGCGGSSTPPPPTPPATASGGLSPRTVRYPAAGVSFRPPAGWSLRPGKAPLVAVAQSGLATVAVWRYPRRERLPLTHPTLVAAKQALVAQILRRDPTFRLYRAKLLHVGRERAVQVLGLGRLQGGRRKIRSTHVYAQHAEFVVDASAPPGVFKRADGSVFLPLLDTLRIAPPSASR